MKVILVGQIQSIHIARWVNLFDEHKLLFYLFPTAYRGQSHPELKKGTVFHTFYAPMQNRNPAKKIGIPLPSAIICEICIKLLSKLFPSFEKQYLKLLLTIVKPDIVHSVGYHSSLLVLQVKKEMKTNGFPYWVYTNWGHDLFLYGKLSEYRQSIRQILQCCDHYTAECDRDIKLAHTFHTKKSSACQLIPTLAGIDIAYINRYRTRIPPSQRNLIMIKGYQHWTGRSLFALKAIRNCKEVLKHFTIILYSITNSDIVLAAKLLEAETGLRIRCLSGNKSYNEILRLHCRARISIGLSISDGISSSFLEAIAAGSFPIQSDSSCANEWITHNKTGCIVGAEDVSSVEQAIRYAVSHDVVVDRAATLNWSVIQKRLDPKQHLKQAQSIYQHHFQAPYESEHKHF